MEKLPLEFNGKGEVAGSKFKQLFRFNDLCLYERISGRTSYEIIKARKQKAKTAFVNGVKVEFKEKERYPSGNEWGTYEFCIQDLPTAIKRFNEQAKNFKYDVVLTEDMLTVF